MRRDRSSVSGAVRREERAANCMLRGTRSRFVNPPRVRHSAGWYKLQHAKGSADEISSSPPRRRGGQLFVIDSKYFDVEVVDRPLEQPVPDAAADKVGGLQLFSPSLFPLM